MISLYVCLFSNGHIKVGRSVNALARMGLSNPSDEYPSSNHQG